MYGVKIPEYSKSTQSLKSHVKTEVCTFQKINIIFNQDNFIKIDVIVSKFKK